MEMVSPAPTRVHTAKCTHPNKPVSRSNFWKVEHCLNRIVNSKLLMQLFNPQLQIQNIDTCYQAGPSTAQCGLFQRNEITSMESSSLSSIASRHRGSFSETSIHWQTYQRIWKSAVL